VYDCVEANIALENRVEASVSCNIWYNSKVKLIFWEAWM
jgi:hypothetical protein